LWKKILHPIGFVAMAAAVFGAIGHFMAVGPKKPKDAPPTGGGAPPTAGGKATGGKATGGKV
jgi:hypothetical protein